MAPFFWKKLRVHELFGQPSCAPWIFFSIKWPNLVSSLKVFNIFFSNYILGTTRYMYSGNFKEGGSTVAQPLHQSFKIKLNHTPFWQRKCTIRETWLSTSWKLMGFLYIRLISAVWYEEIFFYDNRKPTLDMLSLDSMIHLYDIGFTS